MGENTTHGYFYKPSLGAKGAVELALFDAKLDIADAAIKANLDAFATKQPLDAGLTSIAGLTTAANKMIYATALDTYAVIDLTAFARSILDDADEATFKATVSLEIGTDVQAYSAVNALRTDKLNAFAATTSAELKGVISDETGSGALVFGTSPTFITQITTPIIALTGGQIAFPATQSPSADANTLDDYEEGTWTVGVSFGGGTTGITYSSNTGYYTKIGNIMVVSGYLQLTAKGTDTGAALITGLPSTVVNNSAGYGGVSLRFGNITFANQLTAFTIINSTTIGLEEVTEAGTPTYITNVNFTNTSYFIIGLTYRVE